MRQGWRAAPSQTAFNGLNEGSQRAQITPILAPLDAARTAQRAIPTRKKDE